MSPRRGTAVVAALALVALAAALLASATIAVSAGAHALLDERAALAAGAGARRELAGALGGWRPTHETLLPGQGITWDVAPARAGDVVLHGGVGVQRLGATLFSVTVDVRAGEPPHVARRRARLLVQRVAASDSASAPATPVPIRRWSVADLY